MTDRPESGAPYTQSRRAALSKAGAIAGCALAGSFSGCLSGVLGDPLTVGYRPSFATLQGAVLVEEGLLNELDASVEVKNYATEPGSPGKGLNDGTVEVALTTVGQAIQFNQSTARNRITAANNVDSLTVFAGERFAGLWADHGAEAFARFREQAGRPFELVAPSPFGRMHPF